MVASEELEERGLSPGGPFAPPGSKGPEAVTELLEVEPEVLRPQGGALADGSELGRLEMGIGKAG